MKFNALLLLSCTAQALGAAMDDRKELVSSKKLQEKITTKKYDYRRVAQEQLSNTSPGSWAILKLSTQLLKLMVATAPLDFRVTPPASSTSFRKPRSSRICVHGCRTSLPCSTESIPSRLA